MGWKNYLIAALLLIAPVQIFAQKTLARIDTLYWRDSDGDTIGTFLLKDGGSVRWDVGAQRLVAEAGTFIDISFDGNENISSAIGDEGYLRYMRVLKQFRLFTKGTEAVRVDSSQNVGVGAGFNPTERLHVRGAEGSGDVIRIDVGGSGYSTAGLRSSTNSGYFEAVDVNGTTGIMLRSDASSTILNSLIVGAAGTPTQTLDVNGFVERKENKVWDIIAWFAPEDSGATLDTLDLNTPIEVLNFHDDTDSVYVTNTWSAPLYFTSLDSMWIDVLAPNTTGDSVAFAVRYQAATVGEVYAFSSFLADTIDLGTTSNILRRLTITGFSGITAGDFVDFEVKRDNSISQNVATPVSVRRIWLHWR